MKGGGSEVLELPGSLGVPVRSWAVHVALALAHQLGAELDRVLHGELGLLRLRGAAGELLLAATDLDAHRARDDRAERAELLRVLSEAVEGEALHVYMREALPVGFDAAPVGAAVQLWMRDRRGGQVVSERHAIYEDEGVAFELWLPDAALSEVGAPGSEEAVLLPTGGGSGAPTRALGPLLADARLDRVSSWLEAVHAIDSELPLVALVARSPELGCPHGMVRQLLYGRPRWEYADSRDPEARRHGVHREEGGLLARLDRLGALWWLDRRGEVDLRGLAWHSPWRPPALQLPGRAYAPVEEDSGAADEVVLGWKGRVRRWRILP